MGLLNHSVIFLSLKKTIINSIDSRAPCAFSIKSRRGLGKGLPWEKIEVVVSLGGNWLLRTQSYTEKGKEVKPRLT